MSKREMSRIKNVTTREEQVKDETADFSLHLAGFTE